MVSVFKIVYSQDPVGDRPADRGHDRRRRRGHDPPERPVVPYRAAVIEQREQSRRSRVTTQRWFGRVLLAMVAVLVIGGVVGGLALSHTTNVSNRLSDRISPARTGVVQLSAALVDQETGVRGFVLSGETEFLDPYQKGVTQEADIVARIRRLVYDEPSVLADLDTIEARAAKWRTEVADPLIADRRANGERATANPLIDSGKTGFDDIRAQIDALDKHLADIRTAGRADLENARQVRDAVFLGILVFLLAAILVIATLLRLVVLRPLARISADVRRVADGDFERRLEPHGPADLAGLADDVDLMRTRIVEALNASKESNALLEQRQVELQRSNADLEQFAYVASHDLQEPLRKVASFCQMLQRRYGTALDDRAQQYISFAVDGATRMQRLINDLLTFSRIGRVYDDLQVVELDGIVERALGNVATGSVTLEIPSLPAVDGDATLLTMLWQNLLSNAVKFRHPEREPVVRVTATPPGEGERLWRFAVEDNGIGIEPQFADKIFVIFQRLHSRETYSGTGIGLAICKKVVEHHGGAIELDTAYTEGARFTFTLPAATEESA
jgi:signal transduction histidine kinase